MDPAPLHRVPLRVPLDLERTLGPSVQGIAWAPAMRRHEGGVIWAFRSPEGDVTLELRVECPDEGGELGREGTLLARAWGPGTDWAMANLPALVGLEDDLESFQPDHPVLRKLVPKMRGARLPRMPHATEKLVRIVLSQLVTNTEARRTDLELARRYGRPAPGPFEKLRLPPTGTQLGRLTTEALLEAGVLRKQAQTLQYLGRRSAKIDEMATMDLEARTARLQVLRGIGPWSAASLEIAAFGNANAVIVGDYHLPDDIAYALAGKERSDDTHMLELLEPFAPHRGRVALWLHLNGMHAPRRGPKRTPRATRQQIARGGAGGRRRR